jgi:hypothetical protein
MPGEGRMSVNSLVIRENVMVNQVGGKGRVFFEFRDIVIDH